MCVSTYSGAKANWEWVVLCLQRQDDSRVRKRRASTSLAAIGGKGVCIEAVTFCLIQVERTQDPDLHRNKQILKEGTLETDRTDAMNNAILPISLTKYEIDTNEITKRSEGDNFMLEGTPLESTAGCGLCVHDGTVAKKATRPLFYELGKV
ncbi:hypothetical protein TSMEX_007425 [Taenia solium]|eukprot:TsM_000908200 transcript=TsM_000908200 gene=TsM_000908200